MFGCWLPKRGGVWPDTRKLLATLTSAAIWASSSATSMDWPCPVRSLCRTAARIEVAANSPANTSEMATPTLYGGPSSGPVIDISPLMAWIT